MTNISKYVILLYILSLVLSFLLFLNGGRGIRIPTKKIGENIQKSIDKIDEPCYNQVNNPKGGRRKEVKLMLWKEMSYRAYVQDSNNPEPEVWDEIYEPQEYEWIGWILE